MHKLEHHILQELLELRTLVHHIEVIHRTFVLVVGHTVVLVEECHLVVHMEVPKHRMVELVLAALAVRMEVPIHKVVIVHIVQVVHKAQVINFPFDSSDHHNLDSTVQQHASMLHPHIRLIYHHHKLLPLQQLSQ